MRDPTKIRAPSLIISIIWATAFAHILDVTKLLKKWEDKIDPTLRTMIEMGSKFTAKDIKVAELQLEMVNENIAEHFKEFDILITPTLITPAIGINNTLLDLVEVDGKKTNATDWTCYTYPFNFSGHPAASIPCGWSKDGLPIGMQIVGKRFDEVSVFQVSKAFEEVAPWQDKKPNFN